MNALKIGVIGLGRIGKIHLKNLVTQIPSAEVVAVADPYEEFHPYAQEFNIKEIYKDSTKVIDNAFIYFGITTKSNVLIPSIPITFGIPLKYGLGINNPKTMRFILGTNLLNPSIKLLAQKGWDRFGNREMDNGFTEIGRIAEYRGTIGLDFQDCHLFSYGFAASLNVPRFKANIDNADFDLIELQNRTQFGIVLYISKFFP